MRRSLRRYVVIPDNNHMGSEWPNIAAKTRLEVSEELSCRQAHVKQRGTWRAYSVPQVELKLLGELTPCGRASGSALEAGKSAGRPSSDGLLAAAPGIQCWFSRWTLARR